jgi:hypothetical protein
MVSFDSLKNDVKEIKIRVNPEPKHLVLHQTFMAGLNDPHGFLGGSNLHWVTDRHGKETRWFEAVDTETELASYKASYDEMISKSYNKFMKAPDHPYHCFESFLESNRCTCGKHGVGGKQPFYGDVK